MTFLGKYFILTICLLKNANLFVSLFVSLRSFFSYKFSALEIFQGFFFNFINQIARTFGRAVEKLLPGSMVNSHGQFIFGK